MLACVVCQWQAQSGRIAIGMIAVGAVTNVAMLGAVAIGALYEVGCGIEWAYTQTG
ncbi:MULTISPECIES: hypothetical protein [unclassified Methylobacterium]|uniref:hypothetical protein n=1 Tax=unclassified Methylobacterium TaxID=2615210 RepID=UPI00226A00B2|nr:MULTISPECIES: hypothetical protein [unclassified Methylobacterium]